MNMDFIQMVATIFSDIAGIYLCFYFYEGVIERRKMTRLKYVISMVLFISVLIFVNLTFVSVLFNQLSALFVYVSIVLFVFNSKKLVAILLGIFYVIFGTLAELIVVVALSLIMNVSIQQITEVNMFYALGTVMSKIGLFFIISFVIRFVSKKENNMPFSVWMVLLALPLISLYIAIYIFSLQMQVTNTDVSSVIAVFGLLIMNLVAFAAFEYNQRRANEINYYKRANDALEIDQNHYKEMISSHKEVRGLWHDMNNHFITISSLLEENKNLEIKEYVNNIKEVLTSSMKYNISGNIVVDAIVGNKIQVASLAGIRIDTTIAVPKELFIGPLDLSTILGNVLDNAIEACERITDTDIDQVIHLNMGYDNQTLFFKVKNPSNGQTIVKKENRFLSSKKVLKKNHGYGLVNIQKVIDKYSGHYSIQVEDDSFTISLVIPEYI